MRTKKTITAALADFIARLAYEDIPSETAGHVKLCFLDTVGCMLYGCATRPGKILHRAASRMTVTGGARVVGAPWTVNPPLACLVNGSFAGIMAFDDLHHKATVHCGSVAVPAALAAVDAMPGPVTGKVFLTALVAGYETMIRVALSLMPAVRLRGYHPASVVGGFCGAAVASKILALQSKRIDSALGIAGGWCSGLMSAQNGSMIHGMQAPNAGMQGVFAALLAREGLVGTRYIFEEEYGSLPGAVSGTFQPASILDGLGRVFEASETGIKYYPTAGSVSSALDAVAQILETYALPRDSVVTVEVQVNRAVFLHCGFPYRSGPAAEAQMSIIYCVAALLEYGRVTVAEFEPRCLRDPRLRQRIAAVRVEHNPSMDAQGADRGYWVKVTVETVSGQRFFGEVVYPKGSARNRLSLAEVHQKFMLQAGAVLPHSEANALAHTLMTCDGMGNMQDLTAHLAGLKIRSRNP